MALYAMNNLKKKLSVPQHDIVSRGVVTTVAWLTGGGEALETLCFGTLYGWLIIWQQVPQDVSSLSCEQYSSVTHFVYFIIISRDTLKYVQNVSVEVPR